MKTLLIVNQSPWGGSLAVTALRLARSLTGGGGRLAAVFFREDGVYHAVQGRASDAGTPGLTEAWQELGGLCDAPLLLCSSASQRRLAGSPPPGFREAGLAEVLELMASCDRVLSL